MKRVRYVLFSIFLLVDLAGVGVSQTSSTSLQGTVTDPSGSAIPGATVVLSNEAKLERTTTTDAQGGYRLLALPPGTYTLTVTGKGFARYQQTDLQLLVNTPATTNVQLKVGAATEVVNVSGEAPALNQVDASIGNPFTETQIKQEPLDGRNVPELLSLQAGVAYTGNREDLLDPKVKDQDSRNGAVNGARSDQSNITLDGVDVNDQNNGYAFTSVLPVTLDSVQEFRVTTSNYNADQGQGSGAQVALVTKSGTNSLHGSLYEYHRNTITSANDYFVKNAEALSGAPNKPDKLLRNVFGVSVGGPIKKDRAFFFVNYEGTRRREENSTVRTIPSPAMRDGVLQYQCALSASGQLDTVNCPGNSVQGFSNTSYTSQPGYFVMGPNDITNLDVVAHMSASAPLPPPNIGPGPNPYMLQYFQKTYAGLSGNDFSVGDRFNYVGFRFRAPVSFDNNVFIARLDYHLTADGKHTIFWRGALQNIFNPQEPFLPGTPSMETLEDHSKGFVVGYTAVLKPTVVNSFHWGFTRQSTGFVGNPAAQREWNVFYGLDQSFAYSHNAQTPTHNLVDDLSWTKGQHTIQVGGNLGWVRNPRVSLQHSFNEGKGATNWMSPTGFANTGSYLDPATGTNPATGNPYPEPQSAFQYDYPMLGMLGMTSDIVGNYNYDKSGNVVNYTVDANGNPIMATGAPVRRNYGLNWYEFYGQDSWRIKPNLTVTYGLRWSLFPPPWEVNGFQASPTCYTADNPVLGCPAFAFNTGAEFNQMVKYMNQGTGYDAIPFLGFKLAGPANNGPGWYDYQKTNLSPRISVAYSPHAQGGWLRKLFGEGDRTVIRGGFSKVYDRPGMQLLSTFDANPPGGLGQTIQNACCTFGYDDAVHAPRITDINTVPHCGPVDNCADPGNQLFLQPAPPPLHPPSGIQAITWGIDQSLKTPYAYAFDFSVGRELPKKMSLQLAYVGRLGRNLLTQRDLRQPLDLVDRTNGPGKGMDYFQAATALAKVAVAQLKNNGKIDATQITNQMVGPTVAYWQDMLPGPAGGGYQDTFIPGNSFNCSTPVSQSSCLIQAIYDIYYNPGAASYPGNEVVGLGNVDLYGALGDLAGNVLHFNHPDGTAGVAGEMLNEQATSMFAWSSIGNSNYNALQATLRKQFGSAVQFDLNYTYSKSIDITSSATRLGWESCCNVGAPGTRLVNAFAPNARRAVSDFDLTHQINANWIVELPFGNGRHFAANVSRVTDAFIGGWQLSGLTRWTSGFPFTIDNGNFWPTNWDEQGIANMVNRPKVGHFRDPASGNVSVFANPLAAFSDFAHPFPGQSGSRNLIRGDGYAGLDMALAKRWKLPNENQSLQFRWEVFNVPNLHRFNVASGLGTSACTCIASLQQLPGSFGDYTGLLTQPREMQFALRFEF